MSNIIKKQNNILPLTGSKSYDSALAKINAEALISPEGLKNYFQSLRDQGLTVATLNHKIAAVKKSLRIMAERMGQDSWQARYELERVFQQNDLKRVKIETFINPDDCISRQELKTIIDMADVKTGLLIRALYVTAARISELCGIRFIDCDSDKKGIAIKIIGKGRKLRTVFMQKSLFNAIQKIWRGRVYLFETRGGKALHRSNAWRKIKHAGRTAGVEKLHPHTLRHSWATHNLKRLGLHKVSLYLGHADVSTTSKFYIHSRPEMDEILQGKLW